MMMCIVKQLKSVMKKKIEIELQLLKNKLGIKK